MRLYIPVEITARELEAKTLLACCAALAGFDVVIGQIDMIRRFAKMSEPGIFYDKSLHSEYPILYRSLQKIGYRIAVNDEEGLVVYDDQYRNFGVNKDISGVVDMIFAWGEKQKELIFDVLPHFQGNVVLAGNPRIDILRPELRVVHQDNVKSIQQIYGNFILINTRYGFYNNVSGGDAYKEKIKRGECGDNIEYLLRYFEFDARLFEGFVDMVQALSRRYPEQKIVLRPHPSEDIGKWKSLLSGLDNVFVVREGNVHAWILASSLVIHNGCSTAIEALLLDVPCISYRPIISEECDNELPNSISINAYNSEELFKFIDESDLLKQRILKQQWLQTLKEHIYSVDGDLSVWITVDGLMRLSLVNKDVDYMYSLFQKINANLRHYARIFRFFLKRKRNSYAKKCKLNEKWEKCSVDILYKTIQKMSLYRQEFSKLSVCNIYYDCFIINLNKS